MKTLFLCLLVLTISSVSSAEVPKVDVSTGEVLIASNLVDMRQMTVTNMQGSQVIIFIPSTL